MDDDQDALPRRATGRVLTLTRFPNVSGKRMTVLKCTLPEFEALIARTTAAEKTGLPMLSGLTWGDTPSEKGSLRHKANARAVHAVFTDYDAGEISPEEAVKRLEALGLVAVVYTSPSHLMPGKGSRWRIVLPLSAALPPEAYASLVARVNGVFGGALADESFRPTQSFYFGSVKGGSPVKTFLVRGSRYVDDAADLDARAIGPRRPHSAILDGVPQEAVDQSDIPEAIAYAAAMLDSAKTRVIEAYENGESRTTEIFQQAFHLGGYVACCTLSEEQAREALTEAADAVGYLTDYSERDLDRHITNGLLGGLEHPLPWRDPTLAFDTILTPEEEAELNFMAGIEDPPADATERAEPFFMDMADLLDAPAPAREWHVKDWIPAKTVHMLGGDGGTGKSLLGIQLAVATGTGTNWLGHEIGKPGVALYYGAEDDRDELHRRFEDVCRGLDVAPAQHRRRVRWRSAVAEDTVFATVGRKGKVEATPVLRRMEQEIARLKPTLVVLDTLANLHALDPNSQEHAKAFVGLLIAISQRHGCTFVLLAHPSRSGLASGDGDGFSVGWNNGVRSRSYFAADKNNPQIMVLSQKKSNYGQRGLEIKVEWQQGIFVKVNDEYADASIAKHVFLEILDRLARQGQSVSNTTGPNYAPSRFAEEPEAEAACLSKDQLARAMKAMLKDEVLKVEPYLKTDRKQGKRIARGDRDLMPPEDRFTDAMVGAEPHG